MNQKPLIILTGPTAVGKTAASIQLAKAAGGEIISADSMQIYQQMNIGTAKITPEEMQGIPHHLVDEIPPDTPFHVYEFKKMAEQAMRGIWERGHIPVVAGGTGFYIQALLRDIDFTENQENAEYRASLERLAAREGTGALYQMLLRVDPEAAQSIHQNNTKRIIRALEYYELTGQKISVHNEQEKQKTEAYRSCYFVLNDLRERLYERIEQRIDEMLGQGLVEEVRKLQAMGCHRGMVSMQGLGYKEILSYLEGEYTYEQAVDILKRDTRHFAKRQLTWFRRERDVIWLEKEKYASQEELLKEMLERIEQRWGIR